MHFVAPWNREYSRRFMWHFTLYKHFISICIVYIISINLLVHCILSWESNRKIIVMRNFKETFNFDASSLIFLQDLKFYEIHHEFIYLVIYVQVFISFFDGRRVLHCWKQIVFNSWTNYSCNSILSYVVWAQKLRN